ncbi:caspase family protein [Olleya sp. AH-315-K02]|nr:caspase family protein [Olleya sp. AH-315-K02]
METLDNSFALLIGIKDPLLPSVQDATDIGDVLINNAGYHPENVFLVTNERATKKGVLSAFKTLKDKTNVDSKVFLYYSGHGKTYTDGTYYLEVEGFDENNPDSTGIIAGELKEKLNDIIAERLVFFIDSCFAQGMTKGSDLKSTGEKLEAIEKEFQLKNQKLTNPESLVHDLDDEEGMAIISSCKDNQKSLYFQGDRNSLFTNYLLKVLKGENKTRFDSEYIKVLDVVSYLIEEIPKDAARDNLKQNPFVNLQIDKNFELSRAPKEKLDLQQTGISKIETQETIIEKKAVKKVFRQTENANNVILFVHGFSGDAHNTFGKIPDLFMEENRLDGWDMFPFGFNANINPEMGKDVWATVKDINRVSDNLSSAIKHKFKKYNRIAIVAHSLGGIVTQRAILNLDKENRDRISHVLLFGSPNNGITNNAIKKLWQNKISELIQDQPFIKKLRTDWDNVFKNNYPFNLKVVYARKDEYVSKESCLNPFNKTNWATVSGDHFTMANIDTTNNDSYNLILETLTDNEFTNKFIDKQEVNLILGEYDEVIRKLKPNLEKLDEQGLERLIYALEGLGQRKEALKILKSHKLAQNDPDILNVLGGLYKRKYLDDSLYEDGKAAFDCYTKALDLAKKINQTEQICENAINLAFLNLKLEEDYHDMENFANIAIEAATDFRFDKIWKLRALAEGYIYLNNLEKSKEIFIKFAIKANVREKLNTYSNAYSAYVMLNDTENTEDEFMKFLRITLLS